MKRVGRILVVALFATAVWTSGAKAATDWYVCDVSQAGLPLENTLSVRLAGLSSDTAIPPTFSARWFVGNGVTANAMLAVALTAIALDTTVVCRVDPTLSTPEVFRLFLKK